jgi:hypothetical protein
VATGLKGDDMALRQKVLRDLTAKRGAQQQRSVQGLAANAPKGRRAKTISSYSAGKANG